MTVALLLAAGLSRRMGTANKLLTPWRGKPLIRHALDAARASALDDVLIITGHDADAVRAVSGSTTSVQARDYAKGMGASLAAGASAAPVGHAFMVLLGDMPLVSANHINAMLDSFDTVNPLVATADDGTWGHPVLFPARLRDAVANLGGDEGARSILRHEEVATLRIGEAARRDFDTPEAFT